MKITHGAYCCCCYGQYPDRRMIDFEAAFDGPVFDGESHKITIDDLIICETCLKAAATTLGWTPDPQPAKLMEAKETEIRELNNELALERQALGSLEKALADLGNIRRAPRTGPRAPVAPDRRKRPQGKQPAGAR